MCLAQNGAISSYKSLLKLVLSWYRLLTDMYRFFIQIDMSKVHQRVETTEHK